MNVFYIKGSVGDVLLVQLTSANPVNVAIKSEGDVTLIHDEKTSELVGFNLFNAATYVTVEEFGEVKMTEEIVDQLQKGLVKNNVEIKLEVDFSPKFVIGHVLEKDKHPNADKLSVCSVDVGNEKLQIVCGASNIEAGQKVVVAKVGAVMPSGMIIRDAELRGVASSGMICSATELSLPDAKADTGILVLEDNATIGQSFSK